MNGTKQGRLSVKAIIASVIRDLQLTDVSRMYDYLIEWAYEAETQIGSYDTFVRKECEIEFKDNRAKLPRDFYQFIALKVGNQFPEVTNRDFRLFNQDSPYLARKSNFMYNLDTAHLGQAYAFDGSFITSSMKMTIDNNYVHLSSIEDGDKGGLAYTAFDLDDDGMPYIKESHQIAVTAYLVWKVKFSDYTKGKIPHHVYKELENRWYWTCGQARGDDEMPDPKQLEYISNMYHQLLPMPSKNLF